MWHWYLEGKVSIPDICDIKILSVQTLLQSTTSSYSPVTSHTVHGLSTQQARFTTYKFTAFIVHVLNQQSTTTLLPLKWHQ